MKKHIGIIGGGAAGMMAAVTAARKGTKVTILERNDRIGKKILQTGNGKCNLGNRNLTVECYHGGDAAWIKQALERFGTEDTVCFFQKIGLLIKEKNGYLYPVSEQAASVLDVLRYELQTLGVEIIYGCKVQKVERTLSGKLVVNDGDREWQFDAVILTCGGKAAPGTGSDGSGWKIAKKAGVRADSRVRILCDGRETDVERGELQLTEYGISGIPIFQLSRDVNYLLRDRKTVMAEIDFLPDMTEESYENMKETRRMLQEKRTAEEFFTGILNKKLMSVFLKIAGIKPTTPAVEIPEDKINTFYELCRCFRLHITESNPYENAQVAAGGIAVTEVTEDMESKLCPGLYFAGEILDVDGRCGGYNLQWAWSSGFIAGCSAAIKTE